VNGDGLKFKIAGTYRVTFTWQHTLPQSGGGTSCADILVRLNKNSTSTAHHIIYNAFPPLFSIYSNLHLMAVHSEVVLMAYGGYQVFTTFNSSGDLTMKYQVYNDADSMLKIRL
jgi:hypothetical protein